MRPGSGSPESRGQSDQTGRRLILSAVFNRKLLCLDSENKEQQTAEPVWRCCDQQLQLFLPATMKTATGAPTSRSSFSLVNLCTIPAQQQWNMHPHSRAFVNA